MLTFFCAVCKPSGIWIPIQQFESTESWDWQPDRKHLVNKKKKLETVVRNVLVKWIWTTVNRETFLESEAAIPWAAFMVSISHFDLSPQLSWVNWSILAIKSDSCSNGTMYSGHAVRLESKVWMFSWLRFLKLPFIRQGQTLPINRLDNLLIGHKISI